MSSSQYTQRTYHTTSHPITPQFLFSSFFFELDPATGCPLLPSPSSSSSSSSSGSSRGHVHAVLPTKLLLPCPVQWQGSWLLSVDRQEVQVRAVSVRVRVGVG